MDYFSSDRNPRSVERYELGIEVIGLIDRLHQHPWRAEFLIDETDLETGHRFIERHEAPCLTVNPIKELCTNDEDNPQDGEYPISLGGSTAKIDGRILVFFQPACN